MANPENSRIFNANHKFLTGGILMGKDESKCSAMNSSSCKRKHISERPERVHFNTTGLYESEPLLSLLPLKIEATRVDLD